MLHVTFNEAIISQTNSTSLNIRDRVFLVKDSNEE